MRKKLPTLLISMAAGAGALVSARPARADAFWSQASAQGAPIQSPTVKIIGIDSDRLRYQSAGGESDRPLDRIVRIQLDDEAAFNAAEEAFAGGKWDVATDGYLKTLRATNKAWLKPWVTRRLMSAAEKSGRFDAATVAYLDLIARDPAAAAAQGKPALPDARSSYLATAVNDVNNALKDPRLSNDQKQVMLSFLLDLHRARGDQQAAAATMEQILALTGTGKPAAGAAPGATGGTGGTGTGAANAVATGAALARLKLDVASVAIDGKQFQKAIDEINASRTVFTEPRDQADALFLLAAAQHGLAAQSKEPTALQDAAIAYMRVVAHFKDAPGAPRVAESLLRTAAIHEDLNEPATALKVYEQVATQYNDTPAGSKAREAVERLKGAQKSPTG